MRKIAALVCLSAGLFCLFPDNVQAQRRTGNVYSQMGQNDQEALFQFNLVDTKRDSSLINDSNSSEENIGFFSGAIEQYKSRVLGSVLGIACSTTVKDLFGDPDGWTDIIKNSSCGRAIQNSNLDASGIYYLDSSNSFIFLKENEIKEVGLGNIKSEDPVDGDLKAQLMSDNLGNYIAYSILVLNEPVQNYRLNLDDLDLDDIDQNQAINNLKYILEKDLFSQFQIVVKGNEAVTTRILLQKSFQDNITSIPESSSTPSVFAIVVLGVILFVKKHTR